jgi:hypothetical protein
VDWLWTCGATSFGYRDNDNLWTRDGRHVGRFVGNEVYAADGRYLGEMLGTSRLITCQAKIGLSNNTFSPQAMRTTLHTSYVDYSANPMDEGYEDFPEVGALR